MFYCRSGTNNEVLCWRNNGTDSGRLDCDREYEAREKVIARNLATFEIVQKTALETCVRNTTVTKTTFERLFYVKDEDLLKQENCR